MRVRKAPSTQDRSWSLLWTPFAPIAEVTEANREAVAKWLEDRTALLVWLTSVITGSLVLVTLFGKKLGFETPSQLFLSLGALLLFLSVLLNVVCVWQIPKWKYAVRTGQIRDARAMVWDLELSSWLSLTFFLAGLVAVAIGTR
jgi:DMSO reductase anchor subunit